MKTDGVPSCDGAGDGKRFLIDAAASAMLFEGRPDTGAGGLPPAHASTCAQYDRAGLIAPAPYNLAEIGAAKCRIAVAGSTSPQVSRRRRSKTCSREASDRDDPDNNGRNKGAMIRETRPEGSYRWALMIQRTFFATVIGIAIFGQDHLAGFPTGAG